MRVARTVHERDRLELCPIGSAVAASDRKFCRHRSSLRHEKTSMQARTSARRHTVILQDHTHVVTQLRLFDQRGRATGRAGAKTLHLACVLLRQPTKPETRIRCSALASRRGRLQNTMLLVTQLRVAHGLGVEVQTGLFH